jgi:hypothetical protein
MAKSSTVLTIAIIMLLLAFAPSIEGKPTGKADASGGCTCHSTSSTVTPQHNFPTDYTPNQVYNIQISMQGGVVGSEGGFALNVDQGAYSNGGADVTFLTTTATHSNPSQRSWNFDWTAPAAGSGAVSVALATLAANSNGANTGDSKGATTHTINELVSNQPPSASNVQVFSSSTFSKTNVIEDTSIGISYSYSDSDNDPESGGYTEIRWYKNNVIQQMYNDDSSLPASAINAGESWHATVAPHDGTTLGSAVQSNSITVDAAVIPNTAPTVSNYEITAATTGSNIPVTEDLWLGYVYDDSDGDAESGTTVRWFKDSVEQVAWNDATTLPSSATFIGDSWNAKITPSDGIDIGIAYETASITIIDIDSDGDGVFNENDAFPNDATETIDSDADGVGDNGDAFPNDATETMDSDSDGVGDNADIFPNDANETMDSDEDTVGDNADAFPYDDTETMDSDNDTVGDNADVFPNDANETMDSDNDTVGDNADAFPNDANETMDSDADGTGDNADTFPNDPTETMDSDSDSVGDNADAFPNDATETIDSDSDGTGDNSDVFPTDATETLDSDADGVGNNADAFPNDANETMDTDGDGVGDNAQAAAEAKAAKLAAEQSEMYMMIGIAAVVILLSLAAVAVFMKKKGSDELVLSPKQYDNPQPIIQTQQYEPQPITQTQQYDPQPTVMAAATEVQRWTDEAGHTWRTMSDNTTQWWNGSDWQQR